MSSQTEIRIPIGRPSRLPAMARRAALPAALIGVVLVVVTAIVLSLIPAIGGRFPSAIWLILLIAMLLVMGSAAIAVIFGAMTATRLLSRLSEQMSALEQRTAILAEQSVARGQERAGASRILDPELRNILMEIWETLLLPEQERTWRFQRLVEREVQRRLALAERLVASRDFHRARGELQALVERFGRDERVGEAEDRLEKAAEAARANDIITGSQRIQDLMSMGRWDQAEQAARELADKYPVASEPAGLLARVQRERVLFEQRHRQRLHEEIQQFVHQRRWRDAAAAAKRFIENFPKGVDTDALASQMETLEANADIQTRQELERQLKELVRQHLWWEALDLARRIIADYPLSPQANVLRRQIPRLEDLARNHEPHVEKAPVTGSS